MLGEGRKKWSKQREVWGAGKGCRLSGILEFGIFPRVGCGKRNMLNLLKR